MQSLIFFFLCFFIHFLHCMEQPSSEVELRFNKLTQDYMQEFSPSLSKNGLMYFYSSAKSDVDNADSPITILNRTFRNNTSFYAYVDLKRNKNNVKDLMQAKTNSYTLFITPPAHLQSQVFILLIDILKKNPLIFQDSKYKDVCILDILFNVRVDINKNFGEMLTTPRFIIDIVNVFSPNANIDNKPEDVYDYRRTREHTCQLAIFLMQALQKKFDINLTKQESVIKLQKAFQVHPWVWVSQIYYAQDDVNNFNERYNNAFFKPNVTGGNELYAITNQDLEIPVNNTFLYELKKEKITICKKTSIFKFILEQNTVSKNYCGRIIFGKEYNSKSLNAEEKNIMLNVLTNSYFIFLTPIVTNKDRIIDLLNKYKTQNPVVYQENGADVCFNDIVFNIIDFADQVTKIGIVINNIAGDVIKNFQKDQDINTIINAERTKKYTEKLLVFLHKSFEQHKCLELPSGVLDRFNILSGLAHIKDLFFVTQRSPLTKTTLKKEYFDEKYNYAYFKDNITDKPKEYAIDQNLFNNPESMQNNRLIINDVKKLFTQSLGISNNAPLNNNEPTSNMQALLAKLYAFLKAPFVWVYTFVAWLFM